MPKTTQGRRVYPEDLQQIDIDTIQVGDYYKDYNGEFRGIAPNGLWVWLKNHKIVEHADGTITATPSILVQTNKGQLMWHGYLKQGIWEEA